MFGKKGCSGGAPNPAQSIPTPRKTRNTSEENLLQYLERLFHGRLSEMDAGVILMLARKIPRDGESHN